MKTNIELANEYGLLEAFEYWVDESNIIQPLNAYTAAAIEQATAELRHENANNKAAAELLKHALDKSEAMVAMLRDAVESDSKTYNIPLTAKLCEALNNSAKSAEAYENRIKAEAMLELLTKYSFFSSQEGDWLKLAIEKDLAELNGESAKAASGLSVELGGGGDIVEEMRGFAEDHEPDGWPAVRMRQIMALCDEADKARAMMRAEWDEKGEAATLAAAAEDADEWMALIERLHNDGRGPWKFSDATSLERLRGCRRALRRFLTPNK